MNKRKKFILFFFASFYSYFFIIIHLSTGKSFPHSSVGKESACKAGDPGYIPGLGTSTGEGIGYPFQCPWGSVVVQLVKNLPAMQETWVQSLDWENPLEKGKATHSTILAWRIPWVYSPWGHKKSYNWATFTSLLHNWVKNVFINWKKLLSNNLY